MKLCFFITDYHGRISKYEKLFSEIKKDDPEIVLIGGDILPFRGRISSKHEPGFDDFIRDYLAPKFAAIRDENHYKKPEIFLIFGNDDPRIFESSAIEAERAHIWHYIHEKKFSCGKYDFYGYSFIPPSPFMLKDWEKYDVSRYVDPGCSHPHEGTRSVDILNRDMIFSTIKTDLQDMTDERDLSKSVFLFHAPPHDTHLDHSELEGETVDHAPVDPHLGSIAIKRFIKQRQPYLTLHGHIHEASKISGKWMQKSGETLMIQGSHKGSEAAVIKFDLDNPENCEKVLL